MVAHPQPAPMQMTEEENFSFADEQQERYEYKAGYVYACVGSSLRHSIIIANISTQLANQLEYDDYVVTAPLTRVHIAQSQAHRYPDVPVFPGTPIFYKNRNDTLINPVVLVEVLSSGTSALDHGEKLAEYTQIDSLQAYILVEQDKPRIEQFVRQGERQWLYQYVNGLEAHIDVSPLSCTLALLKVYQKVNWDESVDKWL